MPLPVVIAAATAAIAAIYAALPDAVHDITREQFENLAKGETDEFLAATMTAAFERIGLPLDPSDGITPSTITDAINAGPLDGTGIQFSNVFDKEACKRDVMRFAMSQALQAYGVKVTDATGEGMKAALKEYISAQIGEQIAAGAGPWLDAAPELVELAKQLAMATKRGWIDASGNLTIPGDKIMMDEYHVKLRERQQRYAAQHSRKWVPA